MRCRHCIYSVPAKDKKSQTELWACGFQPITDDGSRVFHEIGPDDPMCSRGKLDTVAIVNELQNISSELRDLRNAIEHPNHTHPLLAKLEGLDNAIRSIDLGHD